MILSEKLLEQARKKALNAKKNTILKHNDEVYNLDFDSKHWFYSVTDSKGNWIVNLNTKSATEAKKWLLNWITN
jgi:hypothetical protein